MDSRLVTLRESLESAVDGMSAEQLRWHLPGKWSAAEVLEHLYLTYTGTIKGFEKVRTHGKPLSTRASVVQRVLTFVVVGLRHLPAGRESPAVARPRGLPIEQVRQEIGAKLEAMDAIIAECEERYGRHVKVLDHPILGPLTAAQWRTLHLVHGRHHHKQLVRLRERAARQME
jgi:DinB superfamily